MAKYLLRVQLNPETNRNYTILRDNLLAIGFTKRIKNDKGVEYRLPNGNYFIVTETDMDTVFKAAKKIALAISPKAMILLSETGAMEWFGLQKC